ncbi:MAG: MarR family transcriptional regulator [Gemmatimonadetes bacterium]|nr:MarR family transcriptional regulator [Gemmatimonadota bacterium]
MPRRRAAAPDQGAIQSELKQTVPFHSLGAAATVGLLRTASLVDRRLSAVAEQEGITRQQYNVLRILRGAGVTGLATLAIRDRMIDESPGVTRLVDRLERAALVKRSRGSSDRRQVHCVITPKGLTLLARLDATINEMDDVIVGMLSDAEKKLLISLLDRVRSKGPPK